MVDIEYNFSIFVFNFEQALIQYLYRTNNRLIELYRIVGKCQPTQKNDEQTLPQHFNRTIIAAYAQLSWKNLFKTPNFITKIK